MPHVVIALPQTTGYNRKKRNLARNPHQRTIVEKYLQTA